MRARRRPAGRLARVHDPPAQAAQEDGTAGLGCNGPSARPGPHHPLGTYGGYRRIAPWNKKSPSRCVDVNVCRPFESLALRLQGGCQPGAPLNPDTNNDHDHKEASQLKITRDGFS